MNKVLPFVPSTSPRMPDLDGRRGRVLLMDLRDNRLLQSIMTMVYALPDRALTEHEEHQAVDTEPVEARAEVPPTPRPPRPCPTVGLQLSPTPHPLEHIATVVWRRAAVLRHLPVAMVAYEALVGLVTAPLLFVSGYTIGGITMAGLGGFFCFSVVDHVRAKRPRPEPDEDDSEWAALHYRVRR